MKRFALFLLASAGLTRAQYSLEWSTTDAGGGDSSGGTWSLNGTIAQTDAAGPAAGDTFSLEGGYWTFPEISMDLPELAMTLESGFVILGWEMPAFPVVLESSADLSLWTPVEPPPPANSWIGPQGDRSFFRLRPAP